MKKINYSNIGLYLGPALFLVLTFFFHPVGLSNEGIAILGIAIWMACWWITEAVPIAVTALMPIALFPLTGALDIQSTTTPYGHRYVFLYLGGFLLAIAIEKWKLHKRIALNIIRIIGTDVTKLILGFMVATAFLSMWISNTATAVMMLPIGMALIAQMKDNPSTPMREDSVFGKALMLAIAYSASIGGLATLIGTPPNLVFAGLVQKQYGIEISFMQWIKIGLPISIVLLIICWKYLTTIAFKFPEKSFATGKEEIKRQVKTLGSMSFEEKSVLVVFVFTAFMWIFRALLQDFIPGLDDTVIAIGSAIILFLLPSKAATEKLLDWEDTLKVPWGVILLFGGGLALAEGFTTSGLAEWLGNQLLSLNGLSALLIIFILVTAVNFLTEVTSNLATTAMLLPILASLAVALNIHPFMLLVPATIAASCAFMLPVATPPNAIVFGSNQLRIPDMVRAGFWLNIISIILVTLVVYFLLPVVWELK